MKSLAKMFVFAVIGYTIGYACGAIIGAVSVLVLRLFIQMDLHWQMIDAAKDYGSLFSIIGLIFGGLFGAFFGRLTAQRFTMLPLIPLFALGGTLAVVGVISLACMYFGVQAQACVGLQECLELGNKGVTQANLCLPAGLSGMLWALWKIINTDTDCA